MNDLIFYESLQNERHSPQQINRKWEHGKKEKQCNEQDTHKKKTGKHPQG